MVRLYDCIDGKKRGLVIVLLLVLIFPCFSQTDTGLYQPREKYLHPELNAGFIAGGQIYNQRFVYNYGKTLQLSLNHQASEKVSFGAGLGVEKFKDETFIPVAFIFNGKLKKKNSTPFINTQFGYAFGYNQKSSNYINYNYKGGLFFSPGIGYEIAVNDKYSVRLKLNYKHQFAHISYTPYEEKVYKEQVSIHTVAFTLGLLIK